MSLLEVEDLAIHIHGRALVEGVSFSLERGEALALVGESGSGKSLTALSLLRLLPAGAEAGGRVMLDGVDVLAAPERRLRALRGGVAGMVFQEPMTSLNPLHRIGRQVAEAARLHRPLSRAQAWAEARRLLERAGLAEAGSRMRAFPHQLSGGQRQRAMIAMALANDPALLIADEPTTALDVTIQARILELLAEERRARGLGLLLISHDLNLVRRHADRVCVMRAGRIVEAGAALPLFAAPRHPYTRMLLEAEPGGTPAPPPREGRIVLQVEDLRVRFPPGAPGRPGWLGRLFPKPPSFTAVDGVGFSLREGETLGLVGESGSGKSTIGLALLRLVPFEGVVRLGGQDVAALGPEALRRLRAEAGIVFQDPYGSLSPRMTVGDIVAEGLLVHRPELGRTARRDRALAALRDVGLEEAGLADRFPHELSGGQRQRVAIARALVLDPRLLILDEPTSALDRSVQGQVVALLRDLQARRGLAYLFISHDLSVVRALAHRVLVLRAGGVVEEAETDALFEAPRRAYTRELLAASFMRPADRQDNRRRESST